MNRRLKRGLNLNIIDRLFIRIVILLCHVISDI